MTNKSPPAKVADPRKGQAPYANLWARPGFLIRRLHQIHVAVFMDEFGDCDVTPVQYAVLSVLYSGEALDQVSVAAEVGIDRNNAADVLRRLERRGFVQRISSETDRRAKLTRISALGRNFVENAHGAMERAQERFTGGLKDRDRARLLDLLQKLMLENNETGRAALKKRKKPNQH